MRARNERDLSKLATAYERGLRLREEAEADLKRVEADHVARVEQTVADDLCAGRDVSLNGKTDPALDEARSRVEAVSAGIREIEARAAKLAEKVAADRHKAAEKALTDAVAAAAEAEQALAQRREDASLARRALSRAESVLRRPDQLWNPTAVARVRSAEAARAEWLANQPGPAWLTASPEERQAAEAFRDRRNAEAKAGKAAYHEAVAAGQLRGIRNVAGSGPLKPGEAFPRL